MLARPDVAGIDAVFGQRSSARRILLQQDVPVVVKVSDDRDRNSAFAQEVNDVWYRGRGLAGVYCYAHELRPCASELFDLQRGAIDVDGVGIGHRLNDDGILTADFYAVYIDRY